MNENRPVRELTRSELRDVRKLVTEMCANYDREYGCLPLDSGCFMLGKAYAGGALCKYFRAAVLPLNPELEAVFNGGGGSPLKECKFCGGGFMPTGRQAYCSGACELQGRRRDTAARNRKYRRKS